jgi:hypothetical protein
VVRRSRASRRRAASAGRGHGLQGSTQVKRIKVFWFFFSKKNSLLFEKRSKNFYLISLVDAAGFPAEQAMTPG